MEDDEGDADEDEDNYEIGAHNGMGCLAESEKPCQRVSNADRKVFANPESFCNMLIIG